MKTVTDLDSLGGLQRLLRRNVDLSFTQELLYEECDVSTGYRNVLDTASNNITFSLYNHTKLVKK